MGDKKDLRSDFLFATPSALVGAGRLIDIGATFDAYNYGPTEQMADSYALWSDWRITGQDLRDAAHKFFLTGHQHEHKADESLQRNLFDKLGVGKSA